MRDEDKGLRNFRFERNMALVNLDIDWAKSQMPGTASHPDVYLIALHKARYNCSDICQGLRQKSEDWLRERGYSTVIRPWEGGLPT